MLTLCLLLVTACSSIYAGDQTQEPQQQQAMTPENMPMPSEEEVLQALEEMPEEQLQELEELGRQIINEMSDEELQELADMFGTTVEELRADAQQPPQDTTEQPQEQKKPQQQEQKKRAEQKSYMSTEEARQLISSAISVMERIIQKSESIPDEVNRLSGVMQEMQDIVYHLKIIRNKEHIQRFASSEYKDMINTLQTLTNNLRSIEPRMVMPSEDIEETPYTILGISPDASREDIEAAYRNLQEQYEPDNVAQRLREQGASPRHIRVEQREAQMTFRHIEEAYNTLQDPNMREQLRQRQQAEQRKVQEAYQSLQSAQNEAVQAITTAVYNNKLIEHLESFMKAYEPQELEKKKQMEQAEKKRREEQKQRAQKRPTQTPGGQLEPRVKQGKPPKGTTREGQGAPQAPQSAQPSKQPSQQRPDKQHDKRGTQESQGDGAGQQQDGKQQKEPGATGSDAQRDTKGQPETQQKTQDKGTIQLLQSDFKQFGQAYTQYQQTLTSLQNLTDETRRASPLSKNQTQRIQEGATNLHKFKNEAKISQLQQHARRMPQEVGDMTQEQRTTWSQQIASYISQLQQLQHNIRTAYDNIQNAKDAVRNNEQVQSLTKQLNELNTSLTDIRSMLDPYNTLVSNDRSIIPTYSETVQELHTQYDNNTRDIQNLAERAQNNIIEQTEKQRATNNASKMNKNISEILKPLHDPQHGIDIDRLVDMVRNMGTLTTEQQQQWRQNITQSYIDAINNILTPIQSTHDALESKLSADVQKKDDIAQLMSELNTAKQKLQSISDLNTSIQSDIQPRVTTNESS